MLEKVKLLSKQKDVTSTFNKHFRSVTDSLNPFSWPEDTWMSSTDDTINSIIKKFAFHLSIKEIKEKLKIKSEFSFNLVSAETIKRIINDINIKRAFSVEITTYFFKKYNFISDSYGKFKWYIKTGSFPDSLKYANVRPIYKEEGPFDKKNYKLVSILPLFIKNFCKSNIWASVKPF